MNTVLHIIVILCLFIVFLILYNEVSVYIEYKRREVKSLTKKQIKKLMLQDKTSRKIFEERNKNKTTSYLEKDIGDNDNSEPLNEKNTSAQKNVNKAEVIPQEIKNNSNELLRPKNIKIKHNISQQTDWLKKNKQNTEIGEIGEYLVLEYEKNKLIQLGYHQLVSEIQHVSRFDDSLGYDIISFDENQNQIYIEVKSTTGEMLSDIFITQNELNVMSQIGEKYYLYRVYNINKYKRTGKIQIYKGCNKINQVLNFEPIKVRARVKIRIN